MEATHNNNNNPDDHTFVNDTPDSTKQSDGTQKTNETLDSRVNTDFKQKSDGKQSLTNDEDADTDPNEVADKPTFRNDNH
jgi:hypothetical protein